MNECKTCRVSKYVHQGKVHECYEMHDQAQRVKVCKTHSQWSKHVKY